MRFVTVCLRLRFRSLPSSYIYLMTEFILSLVLKVTCDVKDDLERCSVADLPL